MSLQNLKLNNFNKQRAAAQRNIENSLSAANAQAEIAIKQLLYVRQNPDSIIDAEYTEYMTAKLAPAVASYVSLREKLNNLIACHAGDISAAELAALYPDLNAAVSDFSDNLIG